MPAQKESNSWRRRAADAVEAEEADDNLFPKPPGPRVVLSVLAMLLAAAFVPKMQHGLAARVDRGPAVPRPPPPQLVRPPAPTLPPPPSELALNLAWDGCPALALTVFDGKKITI